MVETKYFSKKCYDDEKLKYGIDVPCYIKLIKLIYGSLFAIIKVFIIEVIINTNENEFD